jgi:hypothetical protein
MALSEIVGKLLVTALLSLSATTALLAVLRHFVLKREKRFLVVVDQFAVWRFTSSIPSTLYVQLWQGDADSVSALEIIGNLATSRASPPSINRTVISSDLVRRAIAPTLAQVEIG